MISLDCFPSLRTINMYPMLFIKKNVITSRNTTTLGASPPLILGFHPSKRHAALIASRNQGSVVLAFTLVLLVLKCFLWRVMLVILIFVAQLQQIYRALLLIVYEHHVVFTRSCHHLILALVAQSQLRKGNTLLLLCLIDLFCYGLLLSLGVGVISARLGLANGLDDPVVQQMHYLSLDRDCSGNRLLLVLRPLFLGYGLAICYVCQAQPRVGCSDLTMKLLPSQIRLVRFN